VIIRWRDASPIGGGCDLQPRLRQKVASNPLNRARSSRARPRWPPSQRLVTCSRPGLLSKLTLTPNRFVRRRVPRTPKLPAPRRPRAADVSMPSSGASWGNRRLKREANSAFTSLKSAAPSPKYHDALARLGAPGSVLNVAPVGNGAASPPVGVGLITAPA
jgi:hypothetical protein